MNHIMDILPKFKGINEKIENIKQSVVAQCSVSYTSQDARMVALDSLQINISSVGMWITALNSLANSHTAGGSFNEKEFLKSVGSGLNIQQTEVVMFDHLRLGFMTSVHFKLDNLFHNILKHLNKLPQRQGYWNLTDSILDQCSLPQKGREKDLLTAFANLRNSLHGNGIHRNNSLSIKIDGLSFDFIKGKRVECASWEHIVVLLNSNIEVLKKILMSPQIVDIKTEINDDFAFGN